MPFHVAILKRPYLDLILAGRKTIECRLTRIACAPFGRVVPGETILLKQSSGPIMARARVGRVISQEDLSPADIDQLRCRYNDQICATSEFWQDRRNSRYASLIWLEDIQPLERHVYRQKGLQAWLVLPWDHPLGRLLAEPG